jgi:DNA-binding NtrC family response regulator
VPSEPAPPQLLSVIELGGYPDFRPLYREAGYEVTVVNSVRKAIAHLKRHNPAVIVAEFNFQSDFRDRTSSLESLLAVVQRAPETRVIIFYEKEFAPQFERLRSRFPVHCALSFPVRPDRLVECLHRGA